MDEANRAKDAQAMVPTEFDEQNNKVPYSLKKINTQKPLHFFNLAVS